MPLLIGEINKLRVKRETDISYILVNDIEPVEVFMHFNQSTRHLVENELVEVFLYYDNSFSLGYQVF